MRIPNHWKRASHRTVAALTMLLAAGCSTLGGATDFDPDGFDRTPGWIAIRDIPAMLQKETTDCGAASLSMVLTHWDICMTMDDVTRNCPAIPEQGIQAKDLRDFARGQGLQSYLIHGSWEDLEKEIDQGHPVIVGLVKPARGGAVTHYEVVVAIHPGLRSVVTLDPAAGWRLNSKSGFQKEWEPAGFLTLVFSRGECIGPTQAAP